MTLRSQVKAIIFVMAGLSALHVQAQEVPQYTSVPKFYDFLPNVVSDWIPAVKNLDPRDHGRAYAEVLGLTAILIYYDQDIINASQSRARKLYLISPTDSGAESRVFFTTKIAGISADLRVPKGTNATMYYIGDGLTSLAILSGLTVAGNITDDKRMLNTASEFAESLVLTGSFILPSKYIAGRESPFRASEDGGVWRPAAGVKAYLSNVSKHDAFPSGHIATVMSGVTILAQNYPDQPWIQPVGYTAMGLLMWAMLNNGEHWAGDYPVGIAIGYNAARTVFERRRPANYNVDGQPTVRKKNYTIMPFANSDGVGLMFERRS
ncbi:MAG: phosphatase PAP2 family protein [Chitinophagaceae bacterium]|nr:phosphatase PAP2 family protein [Oligoflexus sp.]